MRLVLDERNHEVSVPEPVLHILEQLCLTPATREQYVTLTPGAFFQRMQAVYQLLPKDSPKLRDSNTQQFYTGLINRLREDINELLDFFNFIHIDSGHRRDLKYPEHTLEYKLAIIGFKVNISNLGPVHYFTKEMITGISAGCMRGSFKPLPTIVQSWFAAEGPDAPLPSRSVRESLVPSMVAYSGYGLEGNTVTDVHWSIYKRYLQFLKLIFGLDVNVYAKEVFETVHQEKI